MLVPGGNDIDAAIVNLFAMHNRMHDWSYYLGFTEKRWNAQDFNSEAPPSGNDGLEGPQRAIGSRSPATTRT